MYNVTKKVIKIFKMVQNYFLKQGLNEIKLTWYQRKDIYMCFIVIQSKLPFFLKIALLESNQQIYFVTAFNVKKIGSPYVHLFLWIECFKIITTKKYYNYGQSDKVRILTMKYCIYRGWHKMYSLQVFLKLIMSAITVEYN